MNTSLRSSSILLSIVMTICYVTFTSAFAPQHASSSTINTRITTSSNEDLSSPSSTRLYFFGQKKDDGSPGDYVCKDCGYVFTKGPAAWAKLDDKYKCPPCGAPKFRFKKVPKGSVKDTSQEKKGWF